MTNETQTHERTFQGLAPSLRHLVKNADADCAPKYIPDEAYLAMRAALVRLIEQGPGVDPEGDVTLVLGEIGDVWPEVVSLGD